MQLAETLDRFKIKTSESRVEQEFGKLLSSLADENQIEIKTDLESPLALTQLRAVGRWYEKAGFKGSKKIIEDFITDYSKYRVSYQRKGRGELVSAIQQIKEIISRGILGKTNEGGPQ